ncbi:MAG: sigma-54-dependent Fis family transcriptional regulator [Bdellovibrionales bacterium]|nr:sigma-54-dependent Fis family transcriptional regulator [Bdellovibrionales bacterium]
MARLVIVDDDLAIHDLLRVFFQDLGHDVRCFENVTSASQHLKERGHETDLIVSDLRLPDGTGLALMPVLKQNGLDIPLILITAYGSAEIGANALKKGIFDYITKPLNLTELEVICNRAIKLKRLEKSLLDLRSMVDETRRFHGFVGNSTKMREVFDIIDKVADTASSILVTGESGTGKELVARAIHERGRRSSQPFVAINCSAIPHELLESELFGYKKGAFTGATDDRKGLFEEADGGTLFLDEIGDMPALLQAKLLRVLQERRIKRLGENTDRVVDVRIVAATHRDLKTAIQKKEFREDLFFRLCVIKVSIPPLRDRKDDIPLIANHFLRKFASLNEKTISGFTREAMTALLAAPWLGNVRELENTIERAVALCATHWIDAVDLSLETPILPSESKTDRLFARLPTLKELEREYIHHVLTSTGGKKEEVAAILGIDRKTLYRKEREYNLNS